MKSMGIFEVKTHLSKLLEQVEKGESITITKRGEAIAQIIPIEVSRRKKKTADEIIQGFRALRKQVKDTFQARHKINSSHDRRGPSMTRILLDCSMTIAWFFEDEVTEYSDAILKTISNQKVKAVAPALWELEVTNVFLSKIKRNFISFSQAAESLSKLKDLEIEIQPPSLGQNFEIVFPLAFQEKLTSYDANYLHLAISEGIPLASLDKQLCAAAKRVGIKIFYP